MGNLESEALQARLDTLTPTQSLLGVFQRVDGARAVVAIRGYEVAIPIAGAVPAPGDAVQVEMRNGEYVMTGPTKPRPTRGRITATGTPRVTVRGSDGVSYSLPFMSSYTPAVNDDVAVEWSFEGGLVKGRVSTTPAPPNAPPPPSSSQTFHPAPFLASAAGYHVLSNGSYNGNFVPNYGIGQSSAAWYGAAVADSIPDGATITLARIYLAVTQSQYAGPVLQVIDGTGPQARVAVGPTWPISRRSGWADIPAGVGDLLKVAGRGISLLNDTGGSGSDRYQPLSRDPMSFALDLAWQT